MNESQMADRTEEVERIRSDVFRLNLDGMEIVVSQPVECLSSYYNGTGPEFLPEDIRKKLDDLASPLLPAVMVHDVEYALSDGSVNSFRESNKRLLVNCISCSLDAYPWKSAKRYLLLLESYALYRACQKFGWIAWLSAYSKHAQMKGKYNE